MSDLRESKQEGKDEKEVFSLGNTDQDDWLQWYRKDPQTVWTTSLPNFILTYGGIVSLSLYRDYYLNYHQDQTEGNALRLWCQVIYMNRHALYESQIQHTNRGRMSYDTYRPFRKSIESGDAAPLCKFYHRYRDKTGKLLSILEGRVQDDGDCLLDQYRIWLSLFEAMLMEKLGDPFQIHCLVMGLLDRYQSLARNQNPLWGSILNEASRYSESLLGDGMRFGWYDRTYTIAYHRHSCTVPLKEAERLYFAEYTGDAQNHRTFESILMMNDDAKKARLAAKKAAIIAKETKERKDAKDGKIVHKRLKIVTLQRHTATVRPYLQMLDVAALTEFEHHMKNLAKVDPTLAFRSRYINKQTGINTDLAADRHLLKGPFHATNPKHRIAVGRALFRCRKLREWYCEYGTHASVVPDISNVSLVTRNNKPDEIWLYQQFQHPYTHSTSLTHTAQLVLQVFRCVLGIAVNGCSDGRTDIHGDLFKMRNVSSYNIQRVETQDNKYESSAVYNRQIFLFSENYQNEMKHAQRYQIRMASQHTRFVRR